MINSKEAFKLYQLTKFYPACIFTNLISILIPGVFLAFFLNKKFKITIEKKDKPKVLSEKELLFLLEQIQETKIK